MENIEIRFIETQNMDSIIPLLTVLNKEVHKDTLIERVKEMTNQNYKCLGIFDKEKLIGICGLWFLTRHYCGRTIEPDHVVIDESYHGRGIGHQLFEWIFDYAKDNEYEATELNTYVNNPRSHKFYYNLGYEILGFHFVKQLD
jgi:GNAT superfamily N-acetyltransferase